MWTGDNLDIMRGMNSECVDLIYLDPPFNSNRNYSAPIGSLAAGAAFKDTWTLSDLDVAWMGLIADKEPRSTSSWGQPETHQTVHAVLPLHDGGPAAGKCAPTQAYGLDLSAL